MEEGKMKRICVMTVMMVMLFVSAGFTDIKPDLLFYASFDNDLNADWAQGSRVPTIKGDKVFALSEGIRGRGVLVNYPNAFLYYEAENNVFNDEGTVSLWARAVGWESGDGYNHIFTQGKGILYFFFQGQGRDLYWYYRGWDREAKQVVSKRVGFRPTWKSGEWHHLAVTWSKAKGEIALFFDGEEVGRESNVPATIFNTKQGEFFSIGPMVPWDHVSGKADTVIDEYAVYKRVLSNSEIKTLYNDISPGGEKKQKLPAAYNPKPDKDTDGDGLNDAVEMIKLSSPFASDTDEDGLADSVDPKPLVHSGIDRTRLTEATVKRVNDTPTIFMDNRSYYPMAYADPEPGYKPILKKLGDCGFILQLVQYPLPALDDLKTSFTELDFRIEKVLSAIPDGKVIIRVSGMSDNGYSDFYKRYPGDICYFYEKDPVFKGHRPVYSFASDAWKNYISLALIRLVNHLRLASYGDKVAGIQLCMGETLEWWWWASPEINKRSIDHSNAMLQAFKDFLLKKYDNDLKLKKAWNDPKADFNNVTIPLETSRYIYQDGDCFNPQNRQPVIDFLRCYNEVLTDKVLYFARVIKEASENSFLTGFEIEFGPHGYVRNGKLNIKPIYTSPYVDFLSAPFEYKNREPGGHDVIRCAYSTMKLHNKIWFNESDMRTSLSNSGMKEEPGTLTESIEVLKRSFSQIYILGLNAYYLTFGHDWYDEPSILNAMERMQNISKAVFMTGSKSNAEIAVIYDEESLFYANTFTHTADDLRFNALSRMGAPYDLYELDDLLYGRIPKYKVYIFLQAQALTTRERELLKSKIFQENPLVIWLGVPGLLNTDRQPAMNREYMKELTGFQFISLPPKSKLTATDACAKLFSIKAGEPLYHDISASRYYTFFGVENPETCLAVSSDNVCGAAICNMPGYKSMYISSTLVSPSTLRSLAKYAGVHVYAEADDVIYVSDHFLTIHTSRPGTKTIIFPDNVDIYDLWSEKWIINNKNSLVFNAGEKTTYMFYYGNKREFSFIWEEAKKEFAAEKLKRINKRNTLEGKERCGEKTSQNRNDKTVMRLDNGFVKDFLLMGPFKPGLVKSQYKGFSQIEDFLLPLGGEATVAPETAISTIKTDQNQYKWKSFHLLSNCHYGADINLPYSDQAVYYVMLYLELDQDMELSLKCYADDWGKIYFNHEYGESKYPCQTETYTFKGNKGFNRILYKVYNSGGPTGFSIRVLDTNGKPLSVSVRLASK
jgi:hypothetical protein